MEPQLCADSSLALLTSLAGEAASSRSRTVVGGGHDGTATWVGRPTPTDGGVPRKLASPADRDCSACACTPLRAAGRFGVPAAVRLRCSLLDVDDFVRLYSYLRLF